MIVVFGLLIDPLFKVKASMTDFSASNFLTTVLYVMWRRMATGLISVLGFAIGFSVWVIVITWVLSFHISDITLPNTFIIYVFAGIGMGSMTAKGMLVFAKKLVPGLSIGGL